MTRLTDLEYLQLSKISKIGYRLTTFFVAIPRWFLNLFIAIGHFFRKIFFAVVHEFQFIGLTFAKGDYKTKISYFILGFGNLTRKQYIRGALFLLFELVFILYMVFWGSMWLGKFGTLGDTVGGVVEQTINGIKVETTIEGDDSFKILLYGLLTIIFMVALIVTWRINIKQNAVAEQILASGKPLKTDKEDLRSLVDEQFHKTLLALPVLGIMMFTVLPILFMILVAFTNLDAEHDGTANLFTWVGWSNFQGLLNFTSGSGNLGATFLEILGWTLIWAVFATFTNYFLGMIVAMMINKKGIKLKKVWRGLLVLTSAVPQFVSLLYVSHMFEINGLFNQFLKIMGMVKIGYNFWGEATSARILVIVINIWIGIPYLMLITSGVLMNIPADLYESARIDGANAWQQLVKITTPYMLFVTGPYLLTSFTGNLNNFNVIFLLTGGGPTNSKLMQPAGYTDLLITWLFNITTGASNNYKLASVIGILVFLVVASISLIIFNILPSNKNEEDFS